MALDKSLVSMFISFWSCDVQREILTIALDNKTQIFGLFICLFIFVRTPTEGCFWQYNQHLSIRVQQQMQEHEVQLASSKQKK